MLLQIETQIPLKWHQHQDYRDSVPHEFLQVFMSQVAMKWQVPCKLLQLNLRFLCAYFDVCGLSSALQGLHSTSNVGSNCHTKLMKWASLKTFA